jgi:hypothetical protein
MLTLVLGIGAITLAWLWSRSGTRDVTVAPEGSVPGESQFKKYLIPEETKGLGRGVSEGLGGSGGGSGAYSESLTDASLPFDPWAVFGAATVPGLDLSTGVPTDATSGLPVDLGTFLGTSRAVPNAVLPKGAYVAKTYDPAPAPLYGRVTFTVQALGPDGVEDLDVLEGTYAGPQDDLTDESVVVVDRVARNGVGNLQPGRYSIPASKWKYEHTYLSKVTWTAVAPESVGLVAVVNPPKLAKEDMLTLVAKDVYDNTVVWIGIVEDVADDGTYDVSIMKNYRVIHDSGDGVIPRPQALQQALVKLKPNMLVNPKSIPAPAAA